MRGWSVVFFAILCILMPPEGGGRMDVYAVGGVSVLGLFWLVDALLTSRAAGSRAFSPPNWLGAGLAPRVVGHYLALAVLFLFGLMRL